MYTLHQAIAENKTFEATLLLAKQFNQDCNPDQYLAQVDAIVEFLQSELSAEDNQQRRFAQLVRYFYRSLAFSGNDQDIFASKYSLMNQVIDYRTGIPVSLAVLFCEIGTRLGFTLSTIDFPGHFLIRVETAVDRALFIDPLNGQGMDYPALESMYVGITGDEEDGMPTTVLEAATSKSVVVRMLYNLKAAFIREKAFQQALIAVELLITLSPEDPYERRDRGFLLAQLDCQQFARSDYQFFIKHCPQDPSAQLLKIQMLNWAGPNHVVH